MGSEPLNKELVFSNDDGSIPPEQLYLKTSELEEFCSARDMRRAVIMARCLDRAQKSLAEYQEQAIQEMSRIKVWLDEQQRKLTAHMEYFQKEIENYHRIILSTDSKQKTLDLIYAKSSARDVKASPELVDKDKVTGYILENPDLSMFIKHEPKLLWAELKKSLELVDGKALLPGTGEIIPGIEVKPAHTDFTVRVS